MAKGPDDLSTVLKDIAHSANAQSSPIKPLSGWKIGEKPEPENQ